MASPAGQQAGPRVVGRYAIYDAIASGGMATVHYGRLLGPVGFSRTVAIKRLHPQFAQDPEFVTMFLDEARLAGRIRHPNVVATLDVVATSNEIFLVMDYVHGESLARIIRVVGGRGEGIPLPIALRIASDSLQGLHAAHDARDERGMPLNIVHRDISPQNILLGVDGTARLVDFGVAKAAGQGQTTREGQIKGKLGYMAPEQLRAGKVTRQTDIHAFATVFWEMLTGRRLFAGDTEADTIGKVVLHEIPLVAELVPGTPPEVDAVLRRGLAESLSTRYATARDMCLALDACGPVASTIQVADWVQAQVHELLERRAQVVSAIESNQEVSGPHDAATADGSQGKQLDSAKDWVARLSDSSDAAKSTVVMQSSETSVAGVLSDHALPVRRSPAWVQIAVGALGAGGLIVGFLAWTGRMGAPPASPPVAVASPAPSSTEVAAPPLARAQTPAPAGEAAAASTAPSAAPVTSASAAAPRASSAPRSAPGRGRPPARRDPVFDSRE